MKVKSSSIIELSLSSTDDKSLVRALTKLGFRPPTGGWYKRINDCRMLYAYGDDDTKAHDPASRPCIQVMEHRPSRVARKKYFVNKGWTTFHSIFDVEEDAKSMGLVKRGDRWVVDGMPDVKLEATTFIPKTEAKSDVPSVVAEKKVSKIKEASCWPLARSVVQNEEVTRILLYGPPGTGKTSLGFSLDPDCYSITLHDESTVESIVGMYMPKGSGFEFVEGGGTLAIRHGKPYIMNEIIEAGGHVLTKCYELLDDPKVFRYTLPTGEVLTYKKGYKVIATMNGDPENLPPPLLDRFDVVLKIDSPSKEAIESLPEDLHDIVQSMYSNPDNTPATFRKIKSFALLRNILKEDEAGKIAFGKAWTDIKASLKLGKRG